MNSYQVEVGGDKFKLYLVNNKCNMDYVDQETSKLKVMIDTKDSNVHVINRKMNMMSNKIDKLEEICKNLEAKIPIVQPSQPKGKDSKVSSFANQQQIFKVNNF